MSYPRHCVRWGSYLSAEMQSVYSTASVDWAVDAYAQPYVSWNQKLTYKVYYTSASHIFCSWRETCIHRSSRIRFPMIDMSSRREQNLTICEARNVLRLASFLSQAEISDAPVESVCLFHWQVQLVIKIKIKQVRPYVSPHSQAWLVIFETKQSPTVSHFLLFSRRNMRTQKLRRRYCFYISVQTGQNLHESVSTFYKSHPHSQECFLASHAKHVLARFGFCGKSFFSLQYVWHLQPSTFTPTLQVFPSPRWRLKFSYCYGNQPVDCNELFLLLLIPGEYSSRWWSSPQPNTLAVRLTFNTFLPMLYNTFVNILCST